MNKRIAITVFTAVLMGASGVALAGDGNRGYRNSHHGSYGNQHYRGYSNQHYRHGLYSYGYHGGHHYSNGLRYVAGAVVLGSLIHAINSDRRERVVYRTRQPAPRNDFWYRVDTDGQCVEVRLNQQGQEVWTYVDSSYCN